MPRAGPQPAIPGLQRRRVTSGCGTGQSRILADVAAGTVPRTCASFSELHGYTDANGYGGAFERPFDYNETDFWNAVQTAVDGWIKQGGLKGRLTDDEARRIVDEIEF